MVLRLSENAHLSRFYRGYPHPSSLRRTSMYSSFLGISEALHMDIFHQPQRNRFFDSFAENRHLRSVQKVRGMRQKTSKKTNVAIH